MSKRNYRDYHMRTYNPWTWKPVPPETPEQTADRRKRQEIAAKRRKEQENER